MRSPDMMDLWKYENTLYNDGVKTICGIDEAGRGPLAGPVFAAAVLLPPGICIPSLNDSKKLSEKVRNELYDVITGSALAYGIASVSHTEIDNLNILGATFLAMTRAVEKLEIVPEVLLIDGNREPPELVKYRSLCIVGGDGKSASIAAASILAKVSRDRYMIKMAAEYPGYFFEKHKGYGTKLHYEKLSELGPSEIHRTTFLTRWK